MARITLYHLVAYSKDGKQLHFDVWAESEEQAKNSLDDILYRYFSPQKDTLTEKCFTIEIKC